MAMLINPLIISFFLFFKKNRFVISNSWQLYPFSSDISIHHGTTAGIIKNLGDITFGKRVVAYLEKVSAKRAKNVIAVSENCKSELVGIYKIKNSKITIINNFVDETIFHPVLNEQHQSEIRVLFVGSLTERKGVSDLYNFANYIEGREGIKLCIATNSRLGTEKFRDMNNTEVHIGLKLDDMSKVYQGASILYFPTKYDRKI